MPPVNKIRTYGRSSKSIVNSSVDAINVLIAKNKAKVRQKKRKFLVRELPPRSRGETLLVDDSLHVSMEDTFDKLTRGNRCNKRKPGIGTVRHDYSNVPQSFKPVNSFYSPIMTRRRKRTASIIDVSNNSTTNISQAKKFKDNQSCSVIPNFLEPTVDKIDFSLEVERVRKGLPTSLSYIKLPDVKEGEISNNLILEDASMSKREISFDPIFTKTFREKQMIHCSTPLMPKEAKEKIVNYTISPIKNATFPNRDISVSKNLTVPNKSECRNVEYDSESTSSLRNLELKRTPGVLFSMCPEPVRHYRGSRNVDSFQNSVFDIKSRETANSDRSRKSFITLRKRKVLKHVDISKKAKKSKDADTQASFSRTGKNLTMSLAEFNSFVDRINGSGNERNSSQKIHSLSDFESFVAQNKNVINTANGNKTKAGHYETPVNFVTKRRRRLTDSDFPNKSEISKRRLSLQESTNDHPEYSLKDMFVLVPRISINSKRNKTDNSKDDINSLIPMIDRGSIYFQGERGDTTNDVLEACDRYPNIENFSNMNSTQFKRLVVNLTQADLLAKMEDKNDSTEVMNEVSERSKSLFEHDYVRNTVHTRSKAARMEAKPFANRGSVRGKFNNVTKRTVTEERKSSNSKKLSGHKRRYDAISMSPVNSSLNLNVKRPARSKFVSKSSENKSVDKEKSEKSVDKEKSGKSVDKKSDKSEKRQDTDVSSHGNNSSFNSAIDKNSPHVPDANPHVPEADFENFFVNVTKRSANARQTTNKEQSSRHVTDAEKFENFFIGVTQGLQQPPPDSNEMNSVISETHSETNKVNGSEEFDNFFVDIMRSTSESETNKFVMNEDRDVDITEEKGKKEVVINLIKSPWRWKGTSNNPAKANGTVIDLTASVDEKALPEVKTQSPKKEISPKVPDRTRSPEISDIIESSLQESSQVDNDGFRIPMVDNVRKRQSKTLLLKAGKLWRRSLSVYKRSSIMLDLLNAGTCIARNGNGGFCYCPKCNLSRSSKRMSQRRCSIKVVPASPAIDPHKETSILECYAHSTSYVSDQILEDNLENNLRSLSINKRRSSIIQNSVPVTAKELVLRRCGQSEPIPFELCYPKSVLQHCQKIGEGVYGEVFLFRNPIGGTSVMKVIPIEGDLIVNGERQKKFEEIFSEIIIAQELSNLRNNKQNTTGGFAEVQKVQCVQGRYPEKLLDLWELYDETRGSENDSPETFGEDQLYIVLQLANGGQDLEAFAFNNALQAYTMFQQVACTLAIAEEQLSFEHRDLHWGNILLSAVDKNKKVDFRLNGKTYNIMTKGVEVSIIDFTLSRIEYDGVVIFNDLGLDPDLFTAEGDYQFEIYKLMQKKNGNNWQRFEPYTNILWLHYTLDKAVTALRYKNVQTKVHKEYIGKLKHLKNDILSYGSVKEFVSSNF